jgi:hypothetical protein
VPSPGENPGIEVVPVEAFVESIQLFTENPINGCSNSRQSTLGVDENMVGKAHLAAFFKGFNFPDNQDLRW